MTTESGKPLGADPVNRIYHGPGGSVPWMKLREPKQEVTLPPEIKPTCRQQIILAREVLRHFIAGIFSPPESDSK